ncbi:hypothetical protein P691DRAFT_800577 [Macrolepiota fuliginosa MF-IS2]|uniref:Uncharacterized protein n=1 Tax=Macrolepiota fuliginosa MF-IS2 TaxID=1400762 RepID=A0A9P5XEC5_9AGAR|nr:hypothetical protein P691DRAFT_800577 [Macrolepiota fuliginosa MF-IS2]
MCLWCCWSSTEAQHDFEANAGRKTLRRAARSAPRLFGKPVVATNSRKTTAGAAGKYQRSRRHGQTPTSKSPHATRLSAVNPISATVYPSSYRATGSCCPWHLTATRRNRGREEVIRVPIRASSEPDTECGFGYGTGSGANKCGPTPVFIHPRLTADVLPNDHALSGHKAKAKDTTSGFTRPSCSSSSCNRSPPGPGFPERCSRLVIGLAALTACPLTRIPSTPLVLPRESPIYTGSSGDVVHGNSNTPKLSSTTPNPIRTMQVDASMTDTRRDTTNASYIEPSLPATTTRSPVQTCHGRIIGHTDHIFNSHEIAPMDIDVATVTQSYQVTNSPMNQTETFDASEQAFDSNMNATMNTTLTKIGRKRAPIPSILLHHDPSHIDTPVTSDIPALHIPMAETTIEAGPKDIPAHSVPSSRTLRRQKKRLSLTNIATAATTPANSLAPPDPNVPFSPPPFQRSHSPVTPPNSPSRNISPFTSPSPTIVVSAPTTPTPTAADLSRPVPPSPPGPLPSLPRIGTPKRPYYTTVRANMSSRPASGMSQLSSPSASPTSQTFSSASAGRSPSPASGGTPGSPDSSAYYLTTSPAQRATSMIVNGVAVTENPTARIQRPHSTLPGVTVPPLPPVVDIPVPIPIPVQMHMRPSSPVRSILSVLDPANGDDDDMDMEYNQFGVGSSRFGFGKALRERRSGNLRNKSSGGSGYHFPLSFSLSLGRKRGRAFTTSGLGSEREVDTVPPLPVTSPTRSYASIGGFGPGRGCSMSGEMEMRMALAERSLNSNVDGRNGLEPAFKFQRPSYDGEGRMSRGKGAGGKKLLKMRSTMGLTSTSMKSPTSSPSSPLKPRIGSRLKEMGVNFLGRFHGSDTNHS